MSLFLFVGLLFSNTCESRPDRFLKPVRSSFLPTCKVLFLNYEEAPVLLDLQGVVEVRGLLVGLNRIWQYLQGTPLKSAGNTLRPAQHTALQVNFNV